MARQERATRTRCSLIRAAAELFAELGFASASLSAISARAGVSNGALHFHFANKNAVAEAVEAEAAEAVRRLIEGVRAGQGDSLQAVVDVTHRLAGALAGDVVVRAGFALAGDLARRDASPLRREWQVWVEDRLCRAGHAGLLAEGVSWQDAARIVVAVTAGLQVLGGGDASWLSRRGVTRIWQLLLPLLTDERDLAPSGSPDAVLHAPPAA